MTYQEAIDFLYNATPQFQQIGAAAYKPGLDTVRRLSDQYGDPHRSYPVIHVGGTNGKGSTAHTLAAVLQSAGYRVGLFTSPHLVDFRERIRVDGEMIPKEDVVRWLDDYLSRGLGLQPSFFELTTIMAMDWFARSNVDVAVIEVGLGGRLDSTNIISPVLSVITNISFDHMAQLGNTLTAIASEKAGIIKPGTPVVIGESAGKPEVRDVFVSKCREMGAPCLLADDVSLFSSVKHSDDGEFLIYSDTPFGSEIFSCLTGDCQPHNALTIMHAILKLRECGFIIPDKAVREGFSNVMKLTGLMGRWMRISDAPLTIADTGHNEGGWSYLAPRLEEISSRTPLRMVIGFVNDKDVDHILALMPRGAEYYFTRASVPRALPSADLAEKAKGFGLKGRTFESVSEALQTAWSDSNDGDTVFVGGSTFVVADAIDFTRYLENHL